MLRDRLVCGVNKERIQRALLAETKLSFDAAFQKARAMETAAKNAQEIQMPTTESTNNPVLTVKQEPRKETAAKTKCYRCGTTFSRHAGSKTKRVGIAGK